MNYQNFDKVSSVELTRLVLDESIPDDDRHLRAELARRLSVYEGLIQTLKPFLIREGISEDHFIIRGIDNIFDMTSGNG